MSDETNTDRLLDTLITQIGSLTESVDRLVTMEAVRIEKDKHQDEKNEKFEDFIKTASSVISRSKESHAMWDKAKPVLLVFLIIGFLTMAGVNFAG